MQRRHASVLISVSATLAATVLAFTPAGPASAATNPNTDSAGSATVDSGSALVQLVLDPLTTSAKSRPAKGKKVDFTSAATKSQRAQLSAQRNDFKKWLQANAPKAKVTGEYDISLNAVAVRLNGTSLASLRSAPNVKAVEYQGLYRPTIADPDLSIIKAEEAWAQSGGAANAGRGVKVAIVDTGIDITHPCFSEAGFPTTTQLGDRRFTNNKVIAARIFNNKVNQGGYTAEAVQEHGTHVAGTVACDYQTPTNVDGVAVPYAMSGVAPAAQLGNYNIFPGEVADARSEDILNALDAAYADGMDVANMSLGGGAHGFQDLLTHAVDDLDAGNMVVAVASGNSGPGHYTVESPGSAARALTAGASTVGHFVGAPVTTATTSAGAAVGDFATVTSNLTAPLGVTTGDGASGLSKACAALPAGSLTGKIALINRGTCDFSVKIGNAQAAGAVAALVVNNVAGDPTAMGSNGAPNQPTIPAYSLGKAAGEALAATGSGTSTTISSTQTYFRTANDNIMAGFSSQGPSDVDYRVKPDVVAPGVNVLSSIPHQFCDHAPCFAFFQGTSMATPHLAGSAAVVRGQHPSWSAAEVRSAIVNTATSGVLTDSSTGLIKVTDVNIVGAGLENVLSATNAAIGLAPVSVSFGSFPVGSGQSRSITVVVSDLTGVGGNYPVSVSSGGGGVSFTVSPSSVTVPAGGSATVTVTMTSVKGAAGGDHQATLTIGGSHAAVYAFGK
ncbi:MAG: minor extracellular serine protease Vpr [Frankiales bacterium]|nr:minor extracellular serine protease Vpr [Frankiales bacterium]